MMTIGRLAAEVGVGVETIRFYERQGLIEEPPRRPSGYRQYSRQDIERLRFIRRAKQLGFSLREIHDLLTLRIDSDTPCAEVLEKLNHKIADIESRVEDLHRIRAALDRLREQCAANQLSSGPCPFMEALEHGEPGTPRDL